MCVHSSDNTFNECSSWVVRYRTDRSGRPPTASGPASFAYAKDAVQEPIWALSSSLLSDDRDIARMQVDAVNGVDGAFLEELSEEDLVGELGLTRLQARKLKTRWPKE